LIYFRQIDKLPLLHACLIAVGTAILLSGVLALSWRLSDEQTQPAVAQSALAPGLGFVEDTDNEDCDGESTPDAEAEVGIWNDRLANVEPMTPTAKLDTILGTTRTLKRSVRLAEADEIWGELDDDAKDSSPRPQGSGPPQFLPPGSSSGTIEEPDEATSLLRSDTISRRRRRRSTGFPGFTARPSPRHSRRKSPESRWTVDGFFKLGWWRRNDKDAIDQDHDP